MISPRRRLRHWWNKTPTAHAVQTIAASALVVMVVIGAAVFVIGRMF